MQRIIIKGILLASLVLFTGCNREQDENDRSLVVALGASPATLDPRFTTDAYGMRIASLLFSSLVRLGPKLEVIGDAAKSWSYKNLVYTFDLHPGLRFSNGRPLTGEDIEFTFEQYRADNNPFHANFKNIESVSTQLIDDHWQVKIKLKQFSATFLNSDLPVVKLLPKTELLQAGEDFAKTLIGTGSFRFAKQTASEIILESVKDHPYAAPKVDGVVFKIIRDDFTRFQKTLKGSIDIAQAEIPPGKVANFEKLGGQFEVYKYPGLSMAYILINLKNPTLNNLKLRQALAMAINRKEIIQYKLEGFATEASSLLSPSNPYFADDLKGQIQFDPKKAKAIVESLGLKGKEFTLKTSNSQAAVENGKVLANQLSAIGLNVKLQSFEWGTFYDDLKKGNFELATMRWVGVTDPDIYRIAFHSSELPPGRNRGAYINKKLDRLLEEGLKIEDQRKRVNHYKLVQQMVLEDLPIIPLWYDTQISIVHKRIKNYAPSMNGDFSPIINVVKQH